MRNNHLKKEKKGLIWKKWEGFWFLKKEKEKEKYSSLSWEDSAIVVGIVPFNELFWRNLRNNKNLKRERKKEKKKERKKRERKKRERKKRERKKRERKKRERKRTIFEGKRVQYSLTVALPKNYQKDLCFFEENKSILYYPFFFLFFSLFLFSLSFLSFFSLFLFSFQSFFLFWFSIILKNQIYYWKKNIQIG